VLWKTGKEKLAEVCELADDLLAEAKAEIASEKPPVAGRGEKLK